MQEENVSTSELLAHLRAQLSSLLNDPQKRRAFSACLIFSSGRRIECALTRPPRELVLEQFVEFLFDAPPETTLDLAREQLMRVQIFFAQRHLLDWDLGSLAISSSAFVTSSELFLGNVQTTRLSLLAQSLFYADAPRSAPTHNSIVLYSLRFLIERLQLALILEHENSSFNYCAPPSPLTSSTTTTPPPPPPSGVNSASARGASVPARGAGVAATANSPVV